MQPTFFPWIGYLDLINQSDVFVFLDNVQFEKQSWQQRNRVRGNEDLLWLTVPVLRKGKFGQKINEVRINDIGFRDKHLKTIKQCYTKSKYFHLYENELVELYKQDDDNKSLSDFNVKLILWLCEKFGISTKIYISSELDCDGVRSELIVNICKKLESFDYLSTAGAVEYLKEDYDIFKSNKIDVRLHNYNHPTYTQVYEPFIAYASSIDLLFNYGDESMAILKGGQGQPESLNNYL